jgi:hypothetical protein
MNASVRLVKHIMEQLVQKYVVMETLLFNQVRNNARMVTKMMVMVAIAIVMSNQDLFVYLTLLVLLLLILAMAITC